MSTLSFIHTYPDGTRCTMYCDVTESSIDMRPDDKDKHCAMHQKYRKETEDWVDEAFGVLYPMLTEAQMMYIVKKGMDKIADMFEGAEWKEMP